MNRLDRPHRLHLHLSMHLAAITAPLALYLLPYLQLTADPPHNHAQYTRSILVPPLLGPLSPKLPSPPPHHLINVVIVTVKTLAKATKLLLPSRDKNAAQPFHPYTTPRLNSALPSLQLHHLPNMSNTSTPAAVGTHAAADARKEQLTKDLARAKEAGWSNPIPLNYESVLAGEAPRDESRDTAAWLSDAVIYQWDDDFGDVGEPNRDLEKMLFEDENIQRVGNHIKALTFEVNVEGPEKIHPVREVSYVFCYLIYLLISLLVRRCWSASCHA